MLQHYQYIQGVCSISKLYDETKTYDRYVDIPILAHPVLKGN